MNSPSDTVQHKQADKLFRHNIQYTVNFAI